MARVDRLREGRERAALTQAQVAEALEVPRETVSYWETGERTPSLGRLQQLARLYRINVGFLLGREGLDEREGREVLYRGLPADQAKTRLEVETWLDFLDAWTDFLEASGDTLPGARKPDRALNEGFVDDVRRASRLASRVREHYGLGEDALPDLRTLLDELGVLVYSAPLGDLGGAEQGVSGAFYNHPRLGWSILVNTSTTGGRQTFTLAHELAHALYHFEAGGIISRQDEATTDRKERFANAFAAHFLVPGKGLRKRVERYGERDGLDALVIVQLAAYFRVSYSTLLWRLLGEGLIDREQLEEFKGRSVLRMARKLGLDEEVFVKPEGLGLGVERLPFSVLERVKHEIEREELSPSQAAGILGVDEMELQAALFATPAEMTMTDDDHDEREEFAFVYG